MTEISAYIDSIPTQSSYHSLLCPGGNSHIFYIILFFSKKKKERTSKSSNNDVLCESHTCS